MILKMSKNRKKKYKISEIAIKKISKINIKVISDVHNKVINNLAKEVLNISKNDNNSNEVSITYDMNPTKKGDKIIGVALGTIDEVDPLSDSTSYHIIPSNILYKELVFLANILNIKNVSCNKNGTPSTFSPIFPYYCYIVFIDFDPIHQCIEQPFVKTI